MARRKKTLYYHIRFYNRYLEDYKKTHNKFTVIETTYSKKIQTENRNIFFNEEGKTNILLLSTINHVRKDAKDFLGRNSYEVKDTSFQYFGLLDKPVTNKVICKVDIRQAYWQYSLNHGIITESTDYKLNEGFNKLRIKAEENGEFVKPSVLKEMKLRSLGALATGKHIRDYENGKIVHEEYFEEPTKPLYIDINRGIDSLILEANGYVKGCFYYYWDCLFMQKEFTKDAIEFFKAKNYEVHIEETSLEFVPIAGGMLISQKDDKIYMCRREDRHFLEHLL